MQLTLDDIKIAYADSQLELFAMRREMSRRERELEKLRNDLDAMSTELLKDKQPETPAVMR